MSRQSPSLPTLLPVQVRAAGSAQRLGGSIVSVQDKIALLWPTPSIDLYKLPDNESSYRASSAIPRGDRNYSDTGMNSICS